MCRMPQATPCSIWSNVAKVWPALQRMPFARQAFTNPSAPGNSGATVAVVVQPASGDVLQFLKAGIMEVPDLLVVTKADLGEVATRSRRDLGQALKAVGSAEVPVLAVSSAPARIPADGVARAQIIARIDPGATARTITFETTIGTLFGGGKTVTASGGSLSIDADASGTAIVEQYNAGSDPHNLILEKGGQVAFAYPSLDPGGDQKQTVTLTKGTWTLYCSLLNHRSLGMQATLTVDP